MRRPLPLVAALASAALAGACASSGASSAASPIETSRTIISSASPTAQDVELTKDTRLSSATLTASPEQVWQALPAAMADLGLTGGPLIGQARTYIAVMPRVRRMLNKVPLSRYLECGTTPSGMPGADTHLIRLQVTSIVEPAGQGTRLRTQVLASGNSVDGTSAGVIDCATTGAIEARIASNVETRLRQP